MHWHEFSLVTWGSFPNIIWKVDHQFIFLEDLYIGYSVYFVTESKLALLTT